MIRSLYMVSMSTPYKKGFVITHDEIYAPFIIHADILEECLRQAKKMLTNGFHELDVHKIGSDAIHSITSIEDLEELQSRLLED